MLMKFKVFIYLIIGGLTMLTVNSLTAKNLQFPEFSNISVINLQQSIEQQITDYKQIVEDLANNESLQLSWMTLIQPLEDAAAKLDKLVNIASHLNSVKDSLELREVYTNLIIILNKFNSDLLHNKKLYQKILKLSQTKNFSKLHPARQKIIKNLLLNFKLAGINLVAEKQIMYKNLTAELGKLSDQFSKNVLDATQSWSYYVAIENQHKLLGLPEHFLALAAKTAINRGKKAGWTLTLDLPSIDIILKHATDRELRKIIYKAYTTKASELFEEQYLKFDNTKIMQKIIKLRQELACLLGFKNYSEYSLEYKMAKTTNEVQNFLTELAIKSKPVAEKEFQELQEFAKQKDQLLILEPWDINYYSELFKEKLFNLTAEELRKYFSLSKVMAGMFQLANDLYGIKIQEVFDFDTWDPAVKLYKVISRDDKIAGYFYVDLYVREHKQSGAWMGSCLSRHKWADSKLQLPVAFLVTNFIKPINTKEETLLYHNDVITLLHEFGHVLHHVLTEVDYISVAGCNGVEWDAVELPSQFMEKWAYDWDFLQTVAINPENGSKLSKLQFDSLIKMKNYHAGMSMLRQLEFGMFDFNLHMWVPTATEIEPNIQQFLDEIRDKVKVAPVAEFNRFQNSFSHIFAGGYAAGYYSYNWAEVLASDAFMLFQHNIYQSKSQSTQLKAKLGGKFLQKILQQGGSKPALDLYIDFRGKKPSIDAILEYRGLKLLSS